MRTFANTAHDKENHFHNTLDSAPSDQCNGDCGCVGSRLLQGCYLNDRSRAQRCRKAYHATDLDLCRRGGWSPSPSSSAHSAFCPAHGRKRKTGLNTKANRRLPTSTCLKVQRTEIFIATTPPKTSSLRPTISTILHHRSEGPRPSNLQNVFP
jgi:hypothetical protein